MTFLEKMFTTGSTYFTYLLSYLLYLQGVFLEKMFTTGSTSLWMRNVQLGIFAIPLQVSKYE